MRVEYLFLVGLGFDLAGALILARGLLIPPADVRRQASTRIGANPFVEFRLAEDKVDAMFGLTYLAIGFALQILGYELSVGADRETSTGICQAASVGLAFLVAVTLAFGAWRVLRNYFAVRALRSITRYSGEGKKLDEQDTHTLSVYAVHKGCRERNPNEPTREYLKSTLGVDPETDRVKFFHRRPW